MTLKTTAYATGEADNAVLYIRYRLENTFDTPRQVRFFAALRPFQVTPPWQAHQGLGGVSAIRSLAYDNGIVWVNNRHIVVPLSRPDGFGAASFDQGAITEYLKQVYCRPNRRWPTTSAMPPGPWTMRSLSRRMPHRRCIWPCRLALLVPLGASGHGY